VGIQPGIGRHNPITFIAAPALDTSGSNMTVEWSTELDG